MNHNTDGLFSNDGFVRVYMYSLCVAIILGVSGNPYCKLVFCIGCYLDLPPVSWIYVCIWRRHQHGKRLKSKVRIK